MTTLEAGGITGEYLMLTYANDAKLYVPASSLHLISRYAGGAEENAPLHKLGGDAWSRARQKAAEKVRDVAAELLDTTRNAPPKRASRLNTIVSSISCSATASRLKPRRIRRRPLMRYLATCVSRWQWIVWCAAMLALVNRSGDARRFPAVDNHKQVAVLVPTTLLAQQHYDNFRDRFANWPVRIE